MHFSPSPFSPLPAARHLAARLTYLHSLPGPENITRLDLPNGIVVLAQANFNSPSVYISGYLPAGALLDPEDRLGLADFTALALLRGTQQRDFQQIHQALESVGASLGFDSSTHSVTFSGRALAEDLDLVVGLLAEALCAPAFPEIQVERLRAQLLTGLAIRAQDTEAMASLTFDQIVYAGHPYRYPEDGYPETIQAITRDDLVTFWKTHYGPGGLVIAVVGAVEPQKAVDVITQGLGDWQNLSQTQVTNVPPAPPIEGVVRKEISIPGKSQADLIIGAAGPTRFAPEYLAASLGNSILGQFGLAGRLGKVVREQAGLAYYVHSTLSGGPGPGPWFAAAGVDPDNTEKAIDLIRAEIARFVSEPVSVEELADSQANYIGRLPLSLESNAGVASAILLLERYNLGLDYYQRYPDLVNSVTPEQVLEAARCYLNPNRLAIVVAGPKEANP